MVFERFLSHQERIEYFTTWSQNDNMSFMNDKCQSPVYASVLDASFQEKEFESTREFVAQDFNFHTHRRILFLNKSLTSVSFIIPYIF